MIGFAVWNSCREPARGCVWFVVIIAVALLQRSTLGQPLQQPVIRATEVDDMSVALRLDESQIELIRSLFDGYQEVHNKASNEWRRRVHDLGAELQSTGDRALFDSSMRTLESEWRTKRQRIAADFFKSCKSLLTPEQRDSWPRYERDRRRRRNLAVGAFFAGESVDVAALVEELKLEAPLTNSVAPLVEDYCAEIDTYLAVRMATSDEARELDPSGESRNLDAYFAACVRSFEARGQIRAANRRHMEVIAGYLPGEVSAALRASFHLAAYPQYYAPTPADSYAQLLLDSNSLTEVQRRSIERIIAISDEQVAAINARLVKLEDEVENDLSRAVRERDPYLLGLVAGSAALAEESFASSPTLWKAQDVFLNYAQFERQENLLHQKRGAVVAAIDQCWEMLAPDQQATLPREVVPEETKERIMTKRIRAQLIEDRMRMDEMQRSRDTEPMSGSPSH